MDLSATAAINVPVEVVYRYVSDPIGFLRLLEPLFARMGRKQNRADVETLRKLLET